MDQGPTLTIDCNLELGVSPHRALLLRSRTRIEEVLRIVTRASNVPAWDVFVVVADARGELGKQIASTIAETHGSCAAFSSADDAEPWLCVPLIDGGGMELLSEYAPFLIHEVLGRPAQTVALLVVDADDDPLIAFGRLIGPGVS